MQCQRDFRCRATHTHNRARPFTQVPFGTYTLNLESIPEPLDYDTPVINA